ncbi:MAG: SCO family protein [Ginsengibacter sp.]
MKKYVTTILFAAILYSCNDANTTSISNNSGSNSSTTPTLSKNNKDAAAESLFMVTDTFRTQNKKDIVLSSFAGKPTVVGMIFTRCGAACPRLTSDMASISAKLKADKDKVNFVLVSFDTERDDPAQLKMFAKHMGLDASWILLHGSEEAVRTLSVLLNVQFEKDAEGNFSHSNLISVLDKNGMLAFQKEGLEADHKETIEKIETLLK